MLVGSTDEEIKRQRELHPALKEPLLAVPIMYRAADRLAIRLQLEREDHRRRHGVTIADTRSASRQGNPEIAP